MKKGDMIVVDGRTVKIVDVRLDASGSGHKLVFFRVDGKLRREWADKVTPVAKELVL